MCQAPAILKDGTVIACRECWQCRERKVDDWVGRCIAESKTASRTFSITLTYGRDENDSADHVRAALLTYSDVQKYFKRIRNEGYDCRYFAVGEYGSTKGRAHWHLIVFYYGDVPEHEISTRGVDGKIQDVRFSDRHWQWGHAVWEELQDDYSASAAKAVRYVCKYLLKDAGDEASQMLGPRMSKKPPLGDRWLRERAALYVEQGLAPQDLFYTFADVRSASDGSPKKFLLRGVSASNFVQYYVEALTREAMPVSGDYRSRSDYEQALVRWLMAASRYRERPNSELVEEWLDAMFAPLNVAETYRLFMRDMVRAKYRLRGSEAYHQRVALEKYYGKTVKRSEKTASG